jgi:hypothetical protein
LQQAGIAGRGFERAADRGFGFVLAALAQQGAGAGERGSGARGAHGTF